MLHLAVCILLKEDLLSSTQTVYRMSHTAIRSMDAYLNRMIRTDGSLDVLLAGVRNTAHAQVVCSPQNGLHTLAVQLQRFAVKRSYHQAQFLVAGAAVDRQALQGDGAAGAVKESGKARGVHGEVHGRNMHRLFTCNHIVSGM